MATPGIEYISCLWAAWIVNAIAVPLSLKSPIPELQYVLSDARPTGLRFKFSSLVSERPKFWTSSKALFASDPFKSTLNSANNPFSVNIVEPTSHFVPTALQKDHNDPAIKLAQ